MNIPELITQGVTRVWKDSGLVDDLNGQKMVLILGTGIGYSMTVSNVQVWQKDASGNLTQ